MPASDTPDSPNLPTGRPRLELVGPLTILTPPVGETGEPVDVSIDEHCRVAASAHTNIQLASAILCMHASLNGVSTPISPLPPVGQTFSFTVGRALCGVENTLSLTMVYEYNGVPMGAVTASRRFRGVCDYGSCQSSSSGPLFASERGLEPGQPIGVALPRHLKLTLLGLGGERPTLQSYLFGGLLRRAPLFLEYCHELSSDTLAVWKDINLPSPMGRWILRARREAGRLSAELTLYRMTDVEVAPPVVFHALDWRPHGDNVARAAPGLLGGGDFAFHALEIVVEPA